MTKKSTKITIGADPEVRLFKAGKSVPAWEYTEGRKDSPLPLWHGDYGLFSVHSDNVALELNFPPTDVGTGRFSSNATQIVSRLKGLITDWEAVPVAEFDYKHLMHPLATAIGCSEDFCAYTDDPTKPREPLVLASFGHKRFFGGHIHIGYGANDAPAHVMAKFCDLYLALPAIAAGYDKQKERRAHYGVAGLYRPKPYGVEYRTLSNFWMTPNLVTTCSRAIETNVSSMVRMVRDDRHAAAELYNELPWRKVQEVIATEDQAEATSFLSTLYDRLESRGIAVYGPRLMA